MFGRFVKGGSNSAKVTCAR